MRFYLSALDLIGFMGVCTSAALVASTLSLLRLTLVAFLRCKEQISKSLRRLQQTQTVSMTRTSKNGSNWIVVRIYGFSFLVGAKQRCK